MSWSARSTNGETFNRVALPVSTSTAWVALPPNTSTLPSGDRVPPASPHFSRSVLSCCDASRTATRTQLSASVLPRSLSRTRSVVRYAVTRCAPVSIHTGSEPGFHSLVCAASRPGMNQIPAGFQPTTSAFSSVT